MDIRKDYLRYNQLSGELHDLDIQDAKRIETVKKLVIVLESLRMMGNAELKYSALLKNKKFDPPDADDQEEEKDDTEDDVPKVKDNDKDGKEGQARQTTQTAQSTFERKYNHLLIEHNLTMNELEVIRKENEKLLLEVQLLQQSQQSHYRFLSHAKKASYSISDKYAMSDLEEIRKENQKLQLEVQQSSPLLSHSKVSSSSSAPHTGSLSSNQADDQSRPIKRQKVFEKSNFSTTPYLEKIIKHKDSLSHSSKSPALANILNTPSGLLDPTDKPSKKEKGRSERQRLRRGEDRKGEQELDSDEPPSSPPSTPSRSPFNVKRANKEIGIKFDLISDEEDAELNTNEKGKNLDSSRASSAVATHASNNSASESDLDSDSDDDIIDTPGSGSGSISDANPHRDQKAKPRSKNKVILKRKRKIVAGADDSFLDNDTVS
ncbi:unnamed protein product [Ambrosiozyma monospora]|uniref:Unnamed protein product n=1 Tax=Ambrosiozyma monospora TaxID=43982 RepID=A0A9W6Z0F1_AMBMO|nr:unnamed protein product [Ambrosiozyma monospora]